MISAALVLAHAGHWTTWLLYGIPAVLIGGALWAAARSPASGDESWRDDPRLSDSPPL